MAKTNEKMENGIEGSALYSPSDKIVSIHKIGKLLEELKNNEPKKVVQCHGVFDLLHPGHMKHFEEARGIGDVLVVTVTPDVYVNKGPGRPVFNQRLRTESLAALCMVDYVCLNDAPDAVTAINRVKPDIYVKGIEYQNHGDDVTGKISAEARAVEALNGRIHYTNDIVFSSTHLINQYIQPFPIQVQDYLEGIKSRFTCKKITDVIASMLDARVLVIGDAIIDEYQYVEPLGQSGKGINMVGGLLDRETFLGGSLAIARQCAEFSRDVTVLTAVGKNCHHKELIQNTLQLSVKRMLFDSLNETTLTKRRYIHKDGKSLAKLFETYSSNDLVLCKESINKIRDFLLKNHQNYDLIIVSDFGNGFFEHTLMDAVSSIPSSTFVALNTQANSGNRGYNVATHYKKASLLSLNEPEARLTAQDRYSSLERVIDKLNSAMDAKMMCVTLGVRGVQNYFDGKWQHHVPALTMNSVDRVGAGDCFLALAALCLVKEADFEIASFVAAAAAAMEVQIVGNKMPVEKIPLCKYVTRLMK